MTKFKWELWRLSYENKRVTILQGEIDALNQHEVMGELNKKGIAPHTDEYLKIIAPIDLTTDYLTKEEYTR